MGRNEGIDPKSSKTFWGILLGVAFAGIIAWGVFEIFDDDYQAIDVGEDIGWVQDHVEEPDEAKAAERADEPVADERGEYGRLDRPADESR